ncbi:hypothetical protein COV24_04695 [candidate division WWE3 bacterium CG10_big_fil_rev_8_21_14_0_10_32_10]|uniref:Tyrosine recombinase XerC n=1 Tax=candidate division WWE3 bacterium CG10_big_fil_rev_8_21_14_0_10_32_10 TaxID=1975090 RepID=A0A2H0R989_UNCKA|nr:MAG: hypothetical protein COV24_04695 [candidate division WWE3 bacterium CG10_big_fil_rev_8_21_14_0_10_32_10]
MKKLSSHLPKFLEYLEIEKNRSKKTIENYNFYLTRFIGWFGDKKPEQITFENVRKYKLWLARLIDVHGEPLKINTQNYHLIALRSFLKYLAKCNVKTLAPKKIELTKTPNREVVFIEGNDLNKLLEAPMLINKNKSKNESAKLMMYRDKAILELLFSTGLRVSELANLKIKNVNIKKNEFSVMGTDKKTRTVLLSEQAKYWVNEYITNRKDSNPYLFISHDKRTSNTKTLKQKNKKTKLEIEDKPLTPRSIQRIVQKYARTTGITKPVTPHTLRHSHATNLLQNGTDIHNVQTMLGHSSINTTQIYTYIADKKLRDIHKKYHGKKKSR